MGRYLPLSVALPASVSIVILCLDLRLANPVRNIAYGRPESVRLFCEQWTNIKSVLLKLLLLSLFSSKSDFELWVESTIPAFRVCDVIGLNFRFKQWLVFENQFVRPFWVIFFTCKMWKLRLTLILTAALLLSPGKSTKTFFQYVYNHSIKVLRKCLQQFMVKSPNYYPKT